MTENKSAAKVNAKRTSAARAPTAAKVKASKKPKPRPAGGDAPFPLWQRVEHRRKEGKDAPFPLLARGLGYENVAFSKLYQGSRGPKRLTTIVVHSLAELRANAPELLSVGVDFKAIDFKSEELIVVGLGQRPSNAYLVCIDSVVHFTDQLGRSSVSTLVHYSEHVAPGGADVLTYPTVCVRLRRLPDGETDFTH
jgi:hypothetical protein